MRLLDFITTPDGIALISTIGSLFGLKKWRDKRAATAAEIDRWASTAAAAVVLAIRVGFLKSHEEAAASALMRFRALAAALDVQVSPAHEARAIATMHSIIVCASDRLADDAAKQLHGAATELLKNLERLKRLSGTDPSV